MKSKIVFSTARKTWGRPEERTSNKPSNPPSPVECDSAELQGPRKLLRIRPEIFDFEPGLGLKRSQTKPKIPGTVLADRRTTVPKDSGQISACFDDDPKLINCEIAQPSLG